MCLSNGIEGCSSPQKTWQVLESAMKKIMSDVISGVVLDIFGPLHLALVLNR